MRHSRCAESWSEAEHHPERKQPASSAIVHGGLFYLFFLFSSSCNGGGVLNLPEADGPSPDEENFHLPLASTAPTQFSARISRDFYVMSLRHPSALGAGDQGENEPGLRQALRRAALPTQGTPL